MVNPQGAGWHNKLLIMQECAAIIQDVTQKLTDCMPGLIKQVIKKRIT